MEILVWLIHKYTFEMNSVIAGEVLQNAARKTTTQEIYGAVTGVCKGWPAARQIVIFEHLFGLAFACIAVRSVRLCNASACFSSCSFVFAFEN